MTATPVSSHEVALLCSVLVDPVVAALAQEIVFSSCLTTYGTSSSKCHCFRNPFFG